MRDLRLETDFVDYAILATYFVVVYGLLLAVVGLFDSQEEIHRAAGVWALTRPLGEELTEVSDEGGGGTRRDRERPGGGGDAGAE